MTMNTQLSQRADGKCELCAAAVTLTVYDVQPNAGPSADTSLLLCDTCLAQVGDPKSMDEKHWRCLNQSMWSEHQVVQVMAYRVLKSLTAAPWAQDLLGQLYLDDEALRWADAGTPSDEGGSDDAPVLDSNGTQLSEGDTVTLIKDLDVKGANFTAKRGTIVKGINLTDDPRYIEGKVNGTRIVLVAAYLKKA